MLLLRVTVGLLIAAAIVAAQETPRHVRVALFPLNARAYLLGHYRADTVAGFVQLPQELAGGRTIWLRSGAAAPLGKMIAAARSAGVPLEVLSGTRSFRSQKVIWEAKFTGRRLAEGRNLAAEVPDEAERVETILRYSSAPGMSRHHWGTDIDLASTSLGWWAGPQGQKTLDWLKRHAPEYGFQMAYTHGRLHGYRYEPWHWSYQLLSRPMLRTYFARVVRERDITGYLGAEHVRRLKWLEFYVEGVNPALK